MTSSDIDPLSLTDTQALTGLVPLCARRSQVDLRSSGCTHVGQRRDRNEDAWELDDEVGVYAVADGISTCPSGEVAARIAVTTVCESLRHTSLEDPDRFETLDEAVQFANARILHAMHDPELAGMGTTVVALAFENHHQAVVAHVGDSRAYRLRDGQLVRLTRDHTAANDLARACPNRERLPANHPLASMITRALGVRASPLEVELSRASVVAGDLFLLCSDGLSRELGDDEILSLLGRGGEPEAICGRLIDGANRAGGRDNITAVVVEVL